MWRFTQLFFRFIIGCCCCFIHIGCTRRLPGGINEDSVLLQRDVSELGPEERLVVSLMRRRSLTVRPQLCDSCNEAIPVYITYNVIQILALSQSEETLSISGWFTTRWEDYRLTWNASDYADVRQVFLPSHKLWIPDIGVMNGKDNNDFDFSTKSQSRLSVTSEGKVEWLHGVILDVTCPLNVTNFPFDIQTCHLILTPWQSHVHQFVIRPMQLGSTVDNSYLPNSNVSEWEILSVEFRNHEYTSQFNLTYQYMLITITLKRQPLYFVILVLIPFGMLSLLACLIFTLNETGDRLSVALSLVLSMTMYVVIVASNAPRSMRTLPVLCIYLLNQLGLLCCATVLSVVTQKMREYNPLLSNAAGLLLSKPSPPSAQHAEEFHTVVNHKWNSSTRCQHQSSSMELLEQGSSAGEAFVSRNNDMANLLVESASTSAVVLRPFRGQSNSFQESPVPALKLAWSAAGNMKHNTHRQRLVNAKNSIRMRSSPQIPGNQHRMLPPLYPASHEELSASPCRRSATPSTSSAAALHAQTLLLNETSATRWLVSQMLDRLGLFLYLFLSVVNAVICLIIVPRQ